MNGIGPFRELYYWRGSHDDVVAQLKAIRLAAYVLPSLNGWTAMFPQGHPFTDNPILVQNSQFPLLHFFELRSGMWALRLFISGDLVADFVGSASGSVVCRSCDGDVVRSLDLSIDEHKLASTLHSGGGDSYRATNQFLGWPDGWLHFSAIDEGADKAANLPEGTQAVKPARANYRVDLPLVNRAHLQFPEECYGSHRAVVVAMRKLAKQLISTADPHKVLSQLRGVDCDSHDSPILLSEGLFMGSQRDDAWRLYAPIVALNSVTGRLSSSTARLRQDQFPLSCTSEQSKILARVYWDALQWFWFSLGAMGQFDSIEWWFSGLERSDKLRLFSWFINWIPELLEVSPKIKDHSGSSLPYPFWARGIITAAYKCGWSLPVPDLFGRFGCDWCYALLETGVIEKRGDRFNVSRSFVRGREGGQQ